MRRLLPALAAVALIVALSANSHEATYPVRARIRRLPRARSCSTCIPQTPNHMASFIKLADAHYWDSLTFNRVVKNFVAQGGCPDTPAGFKDSPYNLAPEFVPDLKHVYGAVGAGRDDNPQKLSAGCQFYVVVNKDGLKRLDGNYVVYGQVIRGMDVVEAIVSVPTDSTDAPLIPIPLTVSVVQMSAAQIEATGFKIK